MHIYHRGAEWSTTFSARRQAEDADAMQRFRAQSVRLMGDAKEQGDIEFGGEVLLESKARPRSSSQHCSVKRAPRV